MTELKTLKEIRKEFKNNPYLVNSTGNELFTKWRDWVFDFFVNIVREEAIKWIKYLQDSDSKPEFDYGTSIQEWIAHFFDITGGELK